MDMLDKKTETELLNSILAEIAKAANEIKCAQNDIEKAQSRIRFCTMLTHKLIDRQETNR